MVAMSLFVQPGDIPPNAVILDARTASEYRVGHIPGAVRVDWMKYRDGWTRVGRLPGDLEKLAQKMEKLGVDSERPVVVYDKAYEGWGEGRARGVDDPRAGSRRRPFARRRICCVAGPRGRAQHKTSPRSSAAPFAPMWTSAGAPRSRTCSGRLAPTTRSSSTCAQQTSTGEARPYLSKRGGHVPGAKHLYWRDFFYDDGTRRTEIADLLSERGITPETKVITYCTGGVRSALALFLLEEAGYENVRNYDGSWWEWSADKSKDVELPE